MDAIQKIAVLGDSILKGVQLSPQTSRYIVDNRIDVKKISEKFSVTIRNYSRFGCTVTKGYEVLQKQLQDPAFCDALVMDFGGNDCDFNWREISERPDDEHIPHTPLDVFITKYREIIDLLKSRGIQPILTTLPPIVPQKFFDWFCKGLNRENILKWLGEVNMIYPYQENYSRAVEKIAADAQVPLIDLRGAFLQYRRFDSLLCQDGTHPNTEGQGLITSTFLEYAW